MGRSHQQVQAASHQQEQSRMSWSGPVPSGTSQILLRTSQSRAVSRRLLLPHLLQRPKPEARILCSASALQQPVRSSGILQTRQGLGVELCILHRGQLEIKPDAPEQAAWSPWATDQ